MFNLKKYVQGLYDGTATLQKEGQEQFRWPEIDKDKPVAKDTNDGLEVQPFVKRAAEQ